MKRRLGQRSSILNESSGLIGGMSGCSIFLSILFIVLLACQTSRLAASAQALQPSADLKAPVQLVLRHAVEQEIAAGEQQPFLIPVEAEKFLRLRINPKGLNLSAVLYDSGGQKIAEFICRHDGETPLSLRTAMAGSYRLEMRSLETEAARKPYEIEIVETRAATRQDDDRIAAERISMEAEALRAVWNGESLRQAIGKLEESRAYWRKAGDAREEARALNLTGELYFELGAPKQALGAYNEALSLSGKLNRTPVESLVLSNLCYTHLSLGNPQKALELCTKAVKLGRATGDRTSEAQALNYLGEVHYFSGDLPTALSFYQQALPLWRAAADRRGEAWTLLFIGAPYTDLSETQKAADAYDKSLSLSRSVNDKRGQALTLAAMGNLYSGLGEKQKALDHYYEAQQLFQPGCNPIEEARLLNGLGFVYDELGEKQQAFERYNQALKLFQSVGYRRGEATNLLNIGEINYALGHQEEALDYCRQALNIFRSLGDRRIQPFALKDIGLIYDALKDKTKALQFLKQSLQLNRAGADKREEANVLNHIGYVYFGDGRTQQALDYYGRALPLNRAVKDKFGEATTLYNMAQALRARDNPDEARKHLEAALKIIESLRTNVASQDLRTTYFASIYQRYESYIDLLMRLHKQRPSEGFDALAFAASERARARSLLETLSEAHADIRQGVDAGLLERESALQKALDQKSEHQMQILSGKHTEEEAATVAAEIEQLTAEYDALRAQIRAISPRYAALTKPQPMNLREVRQQILDDETILLEYSLGSERSYLWAISKNGIESFELPDRATIENSARQVYELLVAQQPVRNESLEQFQERMKRSQAELSPQIHVLSKMLLGRVANLLGAKRLIIIPDGALQYIPFQALTVPAPSEQQDAHAQADASLATNEDVPLVRDHEIVYEPSVSVLAMLREEMKRREPARLALAVFADPVFESDDARVQRINKEQNQETSAQPEAGELKTALRDADVLEEGGKLPRLPASKDEAEAIMSLVPSAEKFEAVGFNAKRATAMGADLGQYRILHFATHGLLNSKNPQLSGIVLSLVDEHGQPQNGFLRLRDIYNMNLPVDLVVLSACRTGLGKDVKGEGLVGLTRGFMYAGASRVSPWRCGVDGHSPASWSTRFSSSRCRYTATCQSWTR